MKLKKQNSIMERKGNVRIALVMVLAGMLMASCGTSDKAKQASAGQTPFDGVGIVAHRGYWNCEAGGFARNSVASLKAAQDAGFWGSEFDVNMTADSVLLVFHDSSLGGKRIDQNPYSALRSIGWRTVSLFRRWSSIWSRRKSAPRRRWCLR